jgi:hypothetical protein
MREITVIVNGVKYAYCKECDRYLKEIIVHKSKCIQCTGDFSLIKN